MKENKDELIRLFSEYADYHDEKIILNCLAIRKEILSDVKQLGHHILLGASGSGKTHLLRYLSLPIQLKNPEIEEINFLGIYFHLSQVSDLFLRVWKEKRERDIRLFRHYFTLLVLQRTIVEVESLRFKQEVADKIAKGIAKLLRIESRINSLKDIDGEIKGRQEEVCTFIRDNNTLSKGDFDKPLFDDIKSYIQNFSECILQGLRGQRIGGTQKVISPKAVIFLLIDGVEEIEELAGIFTDLLNFRTIHQLFFLKIGTRRLGDWIKGIPPRNYHLQQIEFSIFKPKEVIQDFEYIVNQRLKAYKEKYPESRLEPDIRRILEDSSQVDFGKVYYGFDNIVLLSSGIPASLFRILQRLFSDVWKREDSIGKIISRKDQHGVIKDFSHEKYLETLSLGTNTNPDLYGLVNGFFKALEKIGLSRFVLERSYKINEDEFNQIVNTLRDAIPTGILHTSDMINFELEPYKKIVEVEFLPNCLLAPEFGITFSHDQPPPYHLPMDKALKWMKEGRRKKKGFMVDGARSRRRWL